MLVATAEQSQGNYSVTVVPGTFTITKVDTLSLTADGFTIVYDGDEHTITVTRNITDGTTIQYSTDGGSTWQDQISWRDVTDGTVHVIVRATNPNYENSTAPADVAVTKRKVTITSGSAEKVYDGRPLTSQQSEVSGDGFVNGEGVSIVYTGSQTNPGTSLNTFTYVFNDRTEEGNYEIEVVPGTLKVTKREEPAPDQPVPQPDQPKQPDRPDHPDHPGDPGRPDHPDTPSGPAKPDKPEGEEPAPIPEPDIEQNGADAIESTGSESVKESYESSGAAHSAGRSRNVPTGGHSSLPLDLSITTVSAAALAVWNFFRRRRKKT